MPLPGQNLSRPAPAPRCCASEDGGAGARLTGLPYTSIQSTRDDDGVLPPGASVDLTRSALFFDGARIAGPILVLLVWAALGTLLALALGGRIMDPVDVEAEAAAGAAV